MENSPSPLKHAPLQGAEVCIGLDLGGTNCRAALVASDGALSGALRTETAATGGLDALLDRLTGLCDALRLDALSRGGRVVGLGIGVPGVIDGQGTIVLSPNLRFLDGIDLGSLLGERVGLPVHLVNDANAIAWGEAIYGSGRAFESFIALTLGTGVGGGLVLKRRLWAGASGAAGEVGHVMVEEQGRPCGCGACGCLEQYASATGIVKTARQALEQGGQSPLGDLAPDALDCRQIALAARSGDNLACGAMREAGRRIGQVLAGIVNLLNLEGAVITGGVSSSLDLMLPCIEEELRLRAFDLALEGFRVVRGDLEDDAGILGAAGMAWDAAPRRV